ncbi:MAG TPA: hypothetical protein DDW50_02685 [Firmicutes bacterium]|nr:hypothetical protein [Bacillota bacterium]
MGGENNWRLIDEGPHPWGGFEVAGLPPRLAWEGSRRYFGFLRIAFYFLMNAGFFCPRLSPAESGIKNAH